jgi:hypothetical protein
MIHEHIDIHGIVLESACRRKEVVWGQVTILLSQNRLAYEQIGRVRQVQTGKRNKKASEILEWTQSRSLFAWVELFLARTLSGHLLNTGVMRPENDKKHVGGVTLWS